MSPNLHMGALQVKAPKAIIWSLSRGPDKVSRKRSLGGEALKIL